MANEEEIAGRTKLIAAAMVESNQTLGAVLRGLGTADRTITTHLSDLRGLAESGRQVRSAEDHAERVGGYASQTQDRTHMEQWNDADKKIRDAVGKSQVAAGELSSRIGGGQRELQEFGDQLAYSSGRLGTALKHLDALEQLPGYAGSDQATGLRTGIMRLQAAVNSADTGIQNTIDTLDRARRAAVAFETSGPLEVNDFQNSQAVRRTSQSLTQTVTGAQNTLRETGSAIYEGGTTNSRAVQFGVGASKGNQQAAAELANAMRAGTNPPASAAQSEAAAQSGTTGSQDLLRQRLEKGQSGETNER